MATGRPVGRPRAQKDARVAATRKLTPEDLNNIPPFPEGLNEDGENMWIRIWAGAKEWLHITDEFIITELCQVYQDKELYRRALELGPQAGGVPRTYKLSNKTNVPHPYVSMLKDARAQMNTYLSSLGFSPADRARIGAVEALQDDPLMDLLKNKLRRTAKRLELLEEFADADWMDKEEEEALNKEQEDG